MRKAVVSVVMLAIGLSLVEALGSSVAGAVSAACYLSYWGNCTGGQKPNGFPGFSPKIAGQIDSFGVACASYNATGLEALCTQIGNNPGYRKQRFFNTTSSFSAFCDIKDMEGNDSFSLFCAYY